MNASQKRCLFVGSPPGDISGSLPLNSFYFLSIRKGVRIPEHLSNIPHAVVSIIYKQFLWMTLEGFWCFCGQSTAAGTPSFVMREMWVVHLKFWSHQRDEVQDICRFFLDRVRTVSWMVYSMLCEFRQGRKLITETLLWIEHDISQVLSQFWRASRSCWSSLASAGLSISRYTMQSSANNLVVDDETCRGRSLMYRRNRVGPRTVPWRTPGPCFIKSYD